MNLNSFSYRVALLLGLMLVVAVVDIWRNGAQATRFREYGFVIVTGMIGSAVGCVNDLITSSISPDYFILGKGLEDGADLRAQAGLYGLRVGFSAGIIGGAVCLYASRRKSTHPPAKFSSLFQMLWMPIAGAILCGVLVPMVLSQFDPAHFAIQLDTILGPEKIDRFRQVWWTHIGLYAGMIIGLATMIFHILKERKCHSSPSTIR